MVYDNIVPKRCYIKAVKKLRITQESDYALRICAALAQAEQPIATSQLAADLCIPPRFASKTLRELMLAELVLSTRGVNGGFALAKEAGDITLRMIIEAIDGRIAIRHCLMGEYTCSYQTDKSKCRFHRVFEELNNIIATRLDMLTLQDMVSSSVDVNELIEQLHRY